MSLHGVVRRDFLRTAIGSAAAMAALPDTAAGWAGRAGERSRVRLDRATGPSRESLPSRIRFAVIGINHPHIYGVVAERAGRILGSNFMDERSIISAIGPVSVDPTALIRPLRAL